MKVLSPHVKGFSLIEMILYVSISSILLFSLTSFLIFLFSSRVKNQSIADVNQEGTHVMQLMTQTIRNSRSINSPALGTVGSSLSLTVADPLLSPTVFDVSSGTLRITEGSYAPIALTNSHVIVSSTTFQNVSSTSSTDRIIKIQFTIDHVNPTSVHEYKFGQTFIGGATLRQ